MCNEGTLELSTSQDQSGWTFATVLYRISETDCYPGVTALLVVSQAAILIDNVSVVLLPVGFCEVNNNNLLLNGDFECDNSVDYAANIVEWQVDGDASVQAIISYDESASSEVVVLSCKANYVAAIYQTIDTFIGAPYTLSLDYSWGHTAAGSAGDVTLRVQASGATSTQNFLLLMPDGSTSSGWANLEGKLTSTDTSTGLEFMLSCEANSNAELYLDNIVMPPVPAPGSQAPTCLANPNQILINGDFDCDDSSEFLYSIPGWTWDNSDPSASVIITTPGNDNSAQAVALSCGNSMTQADSLAQLLQYVTVSSDAMYQMTFSYYWDWVEDGGTGDVSLQAYRECMGRTTLMLMATWVCQRH